MAQRFFIGNLEITSDAFHGGDRVPDKYTPNGDDVSPPLRWSGAPDDTKQYAIVCHDPDAPLTDGYTHWVAYNIPAGTTTLAENETPPTVGVNNAGSQTYVGPGAPAGHGVHHYYFWVYALDKEFDLPAGLTRQELFAQIEDHVLEQARVIGTYSN